MAATTASNERVNPKERWLTIIRQAAEAFVEAAPLSIPKVMQAQAMDRVIAAFRAAAAKSDKFYKATPESLGRAIALCALTGLMPGGPVPEVDLIPRQKRVKGSDGRWTDGPVEINWQIGWRGYVTLTGRAGCHARSVAVFRPDEFRWTEGLDRTLVHVPNPDHEGHGEWDALRLCYVVARYRDGFSDYEVLTRKGIEDRRAKSESWRSYLAAASKKDAEQWEIDRAAETPWVQWPIDMARKTAIRYAASRGLLPFDEGGLYGLEIDRKVDVIDSRDVMPANGHGQLPDYDPLGQGDHVDVERDREPVPTKGVAAVAAAVAPAPASPPPSAAPEPTVAPPQATGTPAGDEPSGGGQERKPKVPAPNSVAEAGVIQARLVTQPAGVPVPFELAKRALREGLGANVRNERVHSALNYGVIAGYWELKGEGDEKYVIMHRTRTTPVDPPPSRQPVPHEEPVVDTGPEYVGEEEGESQGEEITDGLPVEEWSPDDLEVAIIQVESELKSHPKLSAGMPQILNKLGKEAGLPIVADGPVLEGSPVPMLRRYLHALRTLRGAP